MLKIKVTIDAAAAMASLEAKERAMNDREGMHAGIAEAAANFTREHLLKKYVPRNERGDFWADVREGVSSVADASSATVSLNELGINLRYNGGEVKPGKSISSWTGELTRALAIPSRSVPIEGGRQLRPGRAGTLAFIQARGIGRETIGYLVEGEEKEITRGKNKGGKQIVPLAGGDLMFTLRSITRHRGDKGILPPESQLSDVAKQAIANFVDSYEDANP